jgi:hypothetical protein
VVAQQLVDGEQRVVLVLDLLLFGRQRGPDVVLGLLLFGRRQGLCVE